MGKAQQEEIDKLKAKLKQYEKENDMVASGAVRNDMNIQLMTEYKAKLEAMSLPELVQEFFTYLDYTEESDSGRVFNPITIGSSRIIMSQPLGMCMSKLREVGCEWLGERRAEGL